jgi:tetratricopeptide (TPR) repeat protein
VVAALLALALAAPPDPAGDEARRLTREALTLYGTALFHQRADRLVQAARALEEAVRLDPEAVPPRLALVPLYRATGRLDDAARAAAAVLVIDPSQAVTWRTLAQLLHDMRRTPEAVSVLSRGVATPQMTDQPAELIAAHRDLGRLYAALGAHDRAAGSFRTALRLLAEHRAAFQAKGLDDADLNRERAELSEGLGSACLSAGQSAEARAAIEQARASYQLAGDASRSDRLIPKLAAAHAGLGEATQATALLDPYLRGKPRDLEGYVLKAKLMRDAGAANAVPEILRTYVRTNPDYVDLQVLLGDEYRRLRDWSGAERTYRAVVARKADVAAYRGLLAVLSGPAGHPRPLFELVDGALRQADVGDDGKARNTTAAEHARAITLALRQEPAAAGLLLTTAVNELRHWRAAPGPNQQSELTRRMVLWRMLGGIAERAGQLGDAELLLRAALAGAGTYQEGSVYRALLHVLWSQRERQKVIALCEDGLKRANATSVVLLNAHLAEAKAQLGDIDAALAAADLAIRQADSGNKLAMRLLRVYVLLFAERYDPAEAECFQLLQEFTETDDVARIRRRLSHVYSARRQFDRAEEQLRMVLELDPTDAVAHNDLGYQLADLNRKLDEAERLIRRALELDHLQKVDQLEDAGESAAYLDSLGWVLFKQKKYKEALDPLKKAAADEDEGNHLEIWDHLADCYMALGQTKDAVAAWEKGLKMEDISKRDGERRRKVSEKLKKARAELSKD